jgi:hypothetical protein
MGGMGIVRRRGHRGAKLRAADGPDMIRWFLMNPEF